MTLISSRPVLARKKSRRADHASAYLKNMGYEFNGESLENLRIETDKDPQAAITLTSDGSKGCSIATLRQRVLADFESVRESDSETWKGYEMKSQGSEDPNTVYMYLVLTTTA